MSDSVEGRISGQFNAKPKKIFDDLVKAYGLLPYYDGRVVHIASASNIQSRSFTLPQAKVSKVVNTLIRQDLADQYQSIRVLRSERMVKVRGAPQFVRDVEEIVQAHKPKPRKAVLRVEETSSEPELIFKTFQLKYASAADVVLFQGGREFVIPGVASILRSMIGDGNQPAATSVYFSQPQDQTVPGLRGQGLRRHTVSDTDDKAESKPLDVSTGGVATQRNFVTRIEAERNLNAVIVRDYADSMPLYAQLIHQLDKEPLLIEIQVTIIDVDKSKLQDLGVDWQYNDANINTTFGGGNVGNQNGGILFNTVLGKPDDFWPA